MTWVTCFCQHGFFWAADINQTREQQDLRVIRSSATKDQCREKQAWRENEQHTLRSKLSSCRNAERGGWSGGGGWKIMFMCTFAHSEWFTFLFSLDGPLTKMRLAVHYQFSCQIRLDAITNRTIKFVQGLQLFVSNMLIRNMSSY